MTRTNGSLDAAERVLLAARCEEFGPTVGWERSADPRSLLIDVTGSTAWFGSEEALVACAAARLAAWGHAARIVVADAPAAAWAVANFAESACGVRIVPPGEALAALAPLPPAALRLPFEFVAQLGELGLVAIGQLAPFSRDDLAERFGPELLRRYDQALGRLAEPIEPFRPPTEYEVAQSFEFPLAAAEAVERALRSLLRRLVARTTADARGAARLACELTCESGARRRAVVGLLRPCADADYLYELLHLRLEGLRLAEPIVAVRLAAPDAPLLGTRQLALFDDEARGETAAAAWHGLVERLGGRLGLNSVVRVHPSSEHQPEFAYVEEPWIEAGNALHGVPSFSRTSSFSRRRRPTLLAREPLAVDVGSAAPEHAPRIVSFGDRSNRVTRSWGPERIETGWWRGPAVRRDYWRAALDDGRRLWLFRRLADGRWFFHGWFD